MKIIKFTAENIKKLRVVSIKPDGALVQITGANGSGKSSVLDAIAFALGGKSLIDPEPIRKGADRGRVKLDLGDLVVTRLFTAKGSTLEVQAADGTDLKSPQAVLDKLLGTLTFDPLAFLRADPKTRLAMLKEAVPLDVDVHALDIQRQNAFTERTDTSRRLKQLEAEAAALPNPTDAPTAIVSTTDLLADLDAMSKRNAAVQESVRQRQGLVKMIADTEASLASLEEQVRRLRVTHDEQRARLATIPEAAALEDAAPIREQIKGAEDSNRAHYAAVRARELLAAVESVKDEVAALTRQIEDIDETKRTSMERAKFPVDGLAFGDGDVQYNGFPFSQASGAEQLRVSAALAMAANPKLRVLRIKDGSLLDEKSLAILEQLAIDKDYQCWLEIVGAGGKSAIVMEDGHVAAQTADEVAT